MTKSIKKTPRHDPSEIECELRQLAGSEEADNRLIDDLGEQMRLLAQAGRRINLKADTVTQPTLPQRKRPRK